MAEKIATLIKVMKDWTGDAALYRMEPPIANYDDRRPLHFEYVVVSAVVVPYSGPETYIFGADENGHVACYMELDGSEKGFLNHKRALNNADYELAPVTALF